MCRLLQSKNVIWGKEVGPFLIDSRCITSVRREHQRHTQRTAHNLTTKIVVGECVCENVEGAKRGHSRHRDRKKGGDVRFKQYLKNNKIT